MRLRRSSPVPAARAPAGLAHEQNRLLLSALQPPTAAADVQVYLAGLCPGRAERRQGCAVRCAQSEGSLDTIHGADFGHDSARHGTLGT